MRPVLPRNELTEELRVRFRTTQRPHGLLSRRHQVRLLLLLLALAAVLGGRRIVGRPDFWKPLFDGGEAVTGTEPPAPVSHAVRRPVYEDPARENARIPELSQELRDVVRDNVIGVTAEEWKAWGVSLKYAEDLQRLLESQPDLSVPQVRYALLMNVPDDCRGRPWRVTGTLRRMTRETVRHSRLGEVPVLDAWLTLPDSGSGLVHVVSRDADRDLPVQERYEQDPPIVTLTGYFLKREAYPSHTESGLSIAPLILAGKISRVPEPAAVTTRSDQLTEWLSWLAVITCGGLGLVIWTFLASDAGHRSERTYELTRLPASPSFDGIDAVSPEDLLSRLEDSAATGSVPEAFQQGILD